MNTFEAGPTTATDRTWALVAHIGTLLAAWVAMGFLAPLIVLLLNNSSPFVRRHAVESLNFQISLLIYTLIGVLIVLFTIGFGILLVLPVAVGVALLALIFIIQATLAARDGRDYRYPLTIRLIP